MYKKNEKEATATTKKAEIREQIYIAGVGAPPGAGAYLNAAADPYAEGFFASAVAALRLVKAQGQRAVYASEVLGEIDDLIAQLSQAGIILE